jgi:mannose-1-phosphate guanylyltransferase
VKAIILAGGKGTRGKPYTEYFPKAMNPINGKPMIDYVVRYLKSFNFIKEVIIISDYNGLGGQIKNYYGDRKDIKFIQDSQSGTGGDLLHIEKELKNESEFLLWFVDNLCAVDVKKMRETFKEKPIMKLQLSECLGIYMLRKEIIQKIKKRKQKQVNLSFDILQELSKEGKVSAHDIADKEWIDAESPMILERNEKLVTKIIKQMGL